MLLSMVATSSSAISYGLLLWTLLSPNFWSSFDVASCFSLLVTYLANRLLLLLLESFVDFAATVFEGAALKLDEKCVAEAVTFFCTRRAPSTLLTRLLLGVDVGSSLVPAAAPWPPSRSVDEKKGRCWTCSLRDAE